MSEEKLDYKFCHGQNMREYPTTDPFYCISYVCNICGRRTKLNNLTGEVFIMNKGAISIELIK